MSRLASSPHFVASYRIGDFPVAGLACEPWLQADCTAVLINAYDFLANRRTRRASASFLQSEEPIHRLLNFDGRVVLDSGAYYFMRERVTSIDPMEIVRIAIQIRADAVVTLDHPFPPGSPPELVADRIARTIEHTEIMWNGLEGRSTPALWPVLHGHDEAVLENCYQRLRCFASDGAATFGLGSLAPLAKSGSLRKILQVIRWARELVGDAQLHIFSVGSPLLLPFALLRGADSVDSQSWIMSAAFKQAQLPGLPQLRLSTQEREKDVVQYERLKERFAESLLRLVAEEGLKVKDWLTGNELALSHRCDALSYIDLMEDRPGENRIHARACHNLQMATFEATTYVRARAAGKMADHLLERHRLTPYRAVVSELLEELDAKGLV